MRHARRVSPDVSDWHFEIVEVRRGCWRLRAIAPDGTASFVNGPRAKTRDDAEAILERIEPRLRRLIERLGTRG
jgi:hypothetical protein